MKISLQEAYAMLGLEEGATEADVRRAYKKCALMYHPDKNSSAEATAQFQRISAAYKRITEPSCADDEEDEIDVAEMAEMFNAMFGSFMHPKFFESMFEFDMPDSGYDDYVDEADIYDDIFFQSQIPFDEKDLEVAFLEHMLQVHRFNSDYESIDDCDDEFDEGKGWFTSMHNKHRPEPLASRKKNKKKKSRRKKNTAPAAATTVSVSEEGDRSVDLHGSEQTSVPIQANEDIPKAVFEIGQEVLVYGKRQGVVRFIGPTHYAKGDWIGVELNEPVGKNSGTVRGVKYFECSVNHGLMVRADDVENCPDNSNT